MDKFSYGNCDISESNLNPKENSNSYWLESFFKISPLEQVEVLKTIFESNSDFSAFNLTILKDIMYVASDNNISVYGKTETGKSGLA